jgi:EamA domain-containing membrane protein RarD
MLRIFSGPTASSAARLHDTGYVFLRSGSSDALLVATGLITVLPLWWYSRAARQLPLMTLGFLQFVPPTCNFLLAALVYHESVPPLKMLAFAFIWAALAVFTLESVRRPRPVALGMACGTTGSASVLSAGVLATRRGIGPNRPNKEAE